MEAMRPLGPRRSNKSATRKQSPSPNASEYELSLSAHENAAAIPESNRTMRKDVRKTARRCPQSVINMTWLPEITIFFLAVFALVAIIVLLAARKDKTLPDWPSLLNINSLVAIFSSVLKAALLFSIAECIGELKWIWFANPRSVRDFDRFDSATRGPWGALKLLFKHSGNISASLGAFITILTLAIDPFTQQILQFGICLRPVEGSSATVARTNNYTIGAFTFAVGSPSVDQKMTAALYQGVLNPAPNASTLISTYCQTGNCTFPNSNGTAYISLAMCTSVEDISQLISGHGSNEEDLYETWDYKLPSGLRLLGGSILTTAQVDPEVQDQDTPLLTLEVLMIKTNCSEYDASSSDECSKTPWAIRASLSPCINTYGSVSYNNSIFEEHIVSMTLLPFTAELGFYTLAGDYPSLPGIDCYPSQNSQGNKTVPTNSLAKGLRSVNYANKSNKSDTLWYDPSCTYAFSYGPTSGLKTSFQDLFFGSVSEPQNITIPRGLADQRVGNAWILSLYADGQANLSSATDYMDGLANSITATIREGGDASNSAPARGTALHSETCVGVNWGWLALPAALVLLTLVFIVMTVIQSHRNTRPGTAEAGREPWKSSSLPLLWCGMLDGTRVKYGRFDEVEAMKESGDGVRVTLRRHWWDEHKESGRYGNSHGRWALREESDVD